MWWEIDPTYYVLKALSWLGIVRDLKSPPDAVLRNEQRLGSKVIDKAAADLAATFNIDGIVASLRHALAGTAALADLRVKLGEAQHQAADVLAGLHLPHLPTRDEVFDRASTMFAKTRSLGDIVERAHRTVLEAVGMRLALS
jgi:stearoyl-CoA desaturase (delta-9 desaturase)